jgi:hypothetical protein
MKKKILYIIFTLLILIFIINFETEKSILRIIIGVIIATLLAICGHYIRKVNK